MLEGQVAVITGGTRGIGRGIAEAFLSNGASVVVNGRNPEKGARAIAEMDAGTLAKRASTGAALVRDDVLRLMTRVDQPPMSVQARVYAWGAQPAQE